MATLWGEITGYEVPRPLPRMTYADAMARYGSDKPDLRFGQELTELTEYFAGTEFRVFQAPYVGAVVMPGGASQTRKRARRLAGLGQVARRHAAWPTCSSAPDGDASAARSPRTSPSPSGRAWPAAVGASPGDAVFFAAGAARASQELLGAARLEIGRRCGLIDESAWSFLWVVDAPMFEETDEGGWTAVHHPFTAPAAGVGRQVRSEPGGALADAYDIVCNGNEIGGGSIRIHRKAMQQQVFDVIGLRPRRRGRSSASCSTRSTTARRRTAASRSAGTGSSCCWRARRRSAT